MGEDEKKKKNVVFFDFIKSSKRTFTHNIQKRLPFV